VKARPKEKSMPTLNLRIAPLQNPERYPALAGALTRITAETLGKRAEVTAVTIDDLPAARWYVGGQVIQRPTAMLDITITAGTNTAAQKSAFIAAAHDELRRQLGAGGPLEEASYVSVREVAATDWGYGGRTQQDRRAPAAQNVPRDLHAQVQATLPAWLRLAAAAA